MMIGILPNAGHATRMLGLPKSLLPIPGGTLFGVMLERLREAGCARVLVGANGPSYDLLNRLYGPEATIYRAETQTMSETVLMAREYTGEQDVLFAMPDTYFEDAGAFRKLSAALQGGADVAVGVFRARPGQHREGGACGIGASGRVLDVIDKAEQSYYPWIWGVLAWRPTFWRHIEAHDPHVGYGLSRAIDAGLWAQACCLDNGYYDAGTPERYFALVNHLTHKAPAYVA